VFARGVGCTDVCAFIGRKAWWPERSGGFAKLQADPRSFYPNARSSAGLAKLAAESPEIETARGLRFSLADLALQAAINGFGVVLGRTTLAYDDLQSRRLIMPFNLQLPAKFSYFVVIPERKGKDKAVGRFREWLLDVAKLLQPPPPRKRATPSVTAR